MTTETLKNEKLVGSKCVACEGVAEPLDDAKINELLPTIPQWQLLKGTTISRTLKAESFTEAMDILNEVAKLAESEGHHPDVHLTQYRVVKIELTTHAVKGLSINDFILAAKIDQRLVQKMA